MSGSKSARNQASIVNRQNVCGGPKKAGLAPRVGWYLSSNTMLIGAPQTIPRFCIPNRIPCYNWWKYGLNVLLIIFFILLNKLFYD